MIRVERKSKGNFEKMIRKFRRQVEDAGIVNEFKDRTHFKKPSEIRRHRLNARKKTLKKVREELDLYQY